MKDLRQAFRTLKGQPGYAAAAVLTLALGIGANTAIFSVVDAVMLRPLPFPEPDRLVDVLAVRTPPSPDTARTGISPADFLAWREQGWVFQEIGAYVPFGTLDWTGGEEPVRLSRHLVSEGLLAALGVRPSQGRLFAAEEYRPGGPRVALLSHRLWQTRFNADPGAVGRRLTLGGEAFQVVGVLPRELRIRGGEPDLLLPLAFGPEAASDRESSYLGAIGRLGPGISIEQARREMATVSRRAPKGAQASLLPLDEVLAGPARPALLVLSGAVAFVLLIACANVSGLQLVRAASREPEIALRSALGADRRRLARQLLAESGALALLGGAGGVLLAVLALALLPDVRGIYLPTDVDVRIDLRVLGFTFVLTLLAGLVSGLAPALRGSRTDLRSTLQTGGAGSQDGGRSRLQDAFVVTEIALALVLLAGAGLLLRSFARLMAGDPGFETAHVLTLELELPAARYPEPAQAAAFYAELTDRLARLPGVVAAGAAKELPPDTPWSFQPALAGRESSEEESAGWQLVTPDYFAAMGTPVLRGQAFTARDREGSRPLTVINESAARRFFPDADPIGRRVRFNDVWHEVAGVVRDQRSPGQNGGPVFYFAHAQLPVPADFLRTMALAVRTEGDPLAAAAAVRRTLWSLDPDLPVAELQPLETRLAGGLFFARSHFNTVLLVLFAGLALVLAMIGTSGVLSYRVSRRTRELGVRMALGADRPDLLRLVMAHGLTLTLAGLLLGLAGAVSLTRFLSGLLYGLGALDPLTLGAVVLLLAAAASAACYLPARRASRLEPLAALRSEP
ncbi:MAG TPA: ABC transporter permease [Thermoanaerobaculia bacterium]|nr:ABC transporter permease [Thermoanaerobaculia bacterium]